MSNRDTIFHKHMHSLKKWSFNEEVAEVFPDMIRRSIPGYSNILFMIGILTRHFVTPHSQVYDLGCSLGEVTLEITRNIHVPGCKIIAVDNAPAMVSRCRNRINNIESSTLIQVLERDILNITIENASLVILNFTLQFLKPHTRLQLLKKIYQGLNAEGALILSEKFDFDNITINRLLFKIHHDFKKIHGYSEVEITYKHNMLKNILLTDTIEKHKQRLKNVGFSHSELCFQYLNFGSIIALK